MNDTRAKLEQERTHNALEAVLLFHSASPWDQAKRTQWWNLTQSEEATTRVLCDVVRLALWRLPSCFGDFKGRTLDDLPKDMPLNTEQQIAATLLGAYDD